jgi:hypothetical protein
MKLSEISSKVLLYQEREAEECAKGALRSGVKGNNRFPLVKAGHEN